ncbi:MAG TPA: ABC transporter permease [Vicinamibacterales bacterium]|nr:ABC transporter permease [Vicinamibacterales bacterium]
MNRFISAGEVRLALRLIVKQPILSITIILALATGVCLTTIGFTFREEITNGQLPYQAGDRFARLFVLTEAGDRVEPSLEQYHQLRDHAVSFEHVGAMGVRSFTLFRGPDEVESIQGTYITPRSMAWLEASPLAGRMLIAADGEPGAERVIVIHESMWRNRYGSDPAMIGRQLIVGGQPRTVVGIMPQSFRFPSSGELWAPLDELTLAHSVSELRMMAVLRPGVSFAAANAEAEALTRSLRSTKETRETSRVMVRPFASDSDESNIAASSMVFVLVMVLLVVASNVATLVFARTWARAPELAVRTALGAARTRVVGQLFFETLLLASIATAIGATAAFAILRYIRDYMGDIPFWVTLQPTWRIVAFAVFLSVLVSVVAGLLPALKVTRHDLRNTLQAGRGFAAGGFGRIGAALLVVEIALSVGLLNGAVTMARSFQSYVDEVPGLPANQVLTVQLGNIRSKEKRDVIVDVAASMRGVVAAGAAQRLPRLYGLPRPTAIEPIGDEPAQAAMPAPSHAVGNGFLEAIGARTLAGRLFTAADFIAGAAPVAVVNEPFVRKFLGGRNPIGRRIRVEGTREDGSQEPWREIVGVVPDLGLSVANASLAGGFYTPVHDEFLYFLAVRGTTDPMKLAPQLRAAVAHIDPDLQLDEFATLEDAGREERLLLTGVAVALTAMGGIALVLSIVGIYALLSFMVTRRTREIGIRVALGATSAQVLRSITGRAMALLAIGGVLGSGLGVLFLSMRSVLLISIPEMGVWMPGTIFLTLALAGGIACWLPARRALGIRPSEALNAD